MKINKVGGTCCKYEIDTNPANSKYCNPNNLYHEIYGKSGQPGDTFKLKNDKDGTLYTINLNGHAYKHICDFGIDCVDRKMTSDLIKVNFFKSTYYVVTGVHNPLKRIGTGTFSEVIQNEKKKMKNRYYAVFYPGSPSLGFFDFGINVSNQEITIYRLGRIQGVLGNSELPSPFNQRYIDQNIDYGDFDRKTDIESVPYDDKDFSKSVAAIEKMKSNKHGVEKETVLSDSDFLEDLITQAYSKCKIARAMNKEPKLNLTRIKTLQGNDLYKKLTVIKNCLPMNKIIAKRLELLIEKNKPDEGVEYVEEHGKKLTGNKSNLNADETFLETRKIDKDFLNHFVNEMDAGKKSEIILAEMKLSGISDYDSEVLLEWLMIRPQKLNIVVLNFIIDNYIADIKRDQLEEILKQHLHDDDDIRDFLNWFFYRFDDNINFVIKTTEAQAKGQAEVPEAQDEVPLAQTPSQTEGQSEAQAEAQVEAQAEVPLAQTPSQTEGQSEAQAEAESKDDRGAEKTVSEKFQDIVNEFKDTYRLNKLNGDMFYGNSADKFIMSNLKSIKEKDIAQLTDLVEKYKTASPLKKNATGKPLSDFLSTKYIKKKGGTRRRNKRTRRRRTLKFR